MIRVIASFLDDDDSFQLTCAAATANTKLAFVVYTHNAHPIAPVPIVYAAHHVVDFAKKFPI